MMKHGSILLHRTNTGLKFKIEVDKLLGDFGKRFFRLPGIVFPDCLTPNLYPVGYADHDAIFLQLGMVDQRIRQVYPALLVQLAFGGAGEKNRVNARASDFIRGSALSFCSRTDHSCMGYTNKH